MLARDGCRIYEEHAIQHVSHNEGLWEAGLEEHNATERYENVRSVVNHNFGGKKSVVEGNGDPEETGVIFRQHDGGESTCSQPQGCGQPARQT